MNPSEKNEIAQLREENRQLLSQVEMLNQKLMEAEAFKSHFLSNVTNEIVNPFASVLGLSRQITELDKTDCEKVTELAALIHSEAASLDFQLRNIFTAARLEAGEEMPEPAKTDLYTLAQTAVEKIRHEAEKKQISIELNVEDTLRPFVTDRNKLELILVNLLSNAVNFSPSGKKVEVRLNLRDDHLILQVRDEGIGMTQEETERIFDRFHRANPRIQSVTPGSGLGLAVVEGLLFLLNGNITVESTPGKGTTLTVTLPEMDTEKIELDDGLFFDDEEGNEESF
jgi:signal transduction histidine kinase